MVSSRKPVGVVTLVLPVGKLDELEAESGVCGETGLRLGAVPARFVLVARGE